MRIKTSIAALTIALIAVASVLSGCGGMPDDAAATVDGNTISKDDVSARRSLIMVLNSTSNTGFKDDYFEKMSAGVEGTTVPDSVVNQEITKQLVAEEIDRLEAEERGITLSAQEIADMEEEILANYFLGDTQMMEEDFAEAGLDRDDLRRMVLGKLYRQKISEELQVEIPVSEEEARAYYDSRSRDYVYPERRQIRQVVLTDEATAQAVADRIAAGENMTVIAQKESTDPKTAAVAGRTDMVLKEELPQAVGDMAFSLAQNQVSPPFRSDLGWYVIRVEVINTSSNRTFEQEKEAISTGLLETKLEAQIAAYEADAATKHTVEYAAGYGK